MHHVQKVIALFKKSKPICEQLFTKVNFWQRAGLWVCINSLISLGRWSIYEVIHSFMKLLYLRSIDHGRHTMYYAASCAWNMLSTGLIQIALYYPYSSKQFHKIYSILVTSGPLHLGKSSTSGRGVQSHTHPTRRFAPGTPIKSSFTIWPSPQKGCRPTS
jgi:hypothetical protein